MKQYYTPELSDLRIGYEYEFTYDGGKTYKKEILTGRDFDQLEIPGIIESKIRVPYFTKEQIKDEGWEFIKIHEMIDPLKEFRKKDYLMTYSEGKKLLTISHIKLDIGEFLFCGTCKSINEFRTILKLLEIK